MSSKNKPYEDKKYKHRREIVIAVYNYKCQCCMQTFDDLLVYHDNRNPFDNDYTNLIPVCDPCFDLVHDTNFYFNLTLKDFKKSISNLDLSIHAQKSQK